MDRSKVPAVLSIAGSDSSGGAGIQADIKTITAHRLYAETAITAITAQNTLGVTAVQDISPDIVAAQIDAVFDDIRPSAVKIGMVSSVEIIEVIADRLSAWNATNVVVDPVMVATSGARLIAEDAAEALTRRLFPLATVITPNIPEATALLDYEVDSERTQQNAAMLLTRRFGCASLVKGGHLVNEANDVLAEPAPLDDEGNHLGDPLTTWVPPQAHRDRQHTRHRLHALVRHRLRAGPGHGSCRRRQCRQGIPNRRSRRRPEHGQRFRPRQPHVAVLRQFAAARY